MALRAQASTSQSSHARSKNYVLRTAPIQDASSPARGCSDAIAIQQIREVSQILQCSANPMHDVRAATQRSKVLISDLDDCQNLATADRL